MISQYLMCQKHKNAIFLTVLLSLSMHIKDKHIKISIVKMHTSFQKDNIFHKIILF